MKVTRIEELNRADLVIKWRCTYACNFHCSYCYQDKNCVKDIGNINHFEIAEKINDLISQNSFKTVELMLIGGECSLLPLPDIIAKIKGLTHLHLTSNFSQTVEFYNQLGQQVKNFELCLSFHSEYFSAEDFINKALKLDKNINLFVEMVQNVETDSANRKLIELCKNNNIPYIVDTDRRQGVNKGVALQSKISPRLKVTFDNGKVKFYENKTDLFFDEDINAYKNKYLELTGRTCSQGYDYIYIKGDKIFDMCSGRKTDIEDWKPEKRICKANGCSFCGRMNIK